MSVHDVHIQACTLEYLCVLGRGGGGGVPGPGEDCTDVQRIAYSKYLVSHAIFALYR